MLRNLTVTTAVLILTPSIAQAYIGPGMGLGAAAMVLGIVAAFFLTMIGLVWFPAKRLASRLRRRSATGRGTIE